MQLSSYDVFLKGTFAVKVLNRQIPKNKTKDKSTDGDSILKYHKLQKVPFIYNEQKSKRKSKAMTCNKLYVKLVAQETKRNSDQREKRIKIKKRRNINEIKENERSSVMQILRKKV